MDQPVGVIAPKSIPKTDLQEDFGLVTFAVEIVGSKVVVDDRAKPRPSCVTFRISYETEAAKVGDFEGTRQEFFGVQEDREELLDCWEEFLEPEEDWLLEEEELEDFELDADCALFDCPLEDCSFELFWLLEPPPL